MPVSYGGQSQQRWGDNTLNQSEVMRDVLLFDTKGKSVGTAAARKKGLLLLAFIRANDPACVATLQALQKMNEGYTASGKLSVLAVSQSETEETAAFAGALGLTFPVLLDRDAYHAMTYGISSVPTVYLTDASGIVLRKAIGNKPAVLQEMADRIATFAEAEPVKL